MHKPNKKYFTCGTLCFGYKCRECIKKGQIWQLNQKSSQ